MPPERNDTHFSRSITLPRGFRAAGGTCGVKPSGKPDFCLIAADQPCSAAAVFTTNAFKGAPVLIGRRHVEASAGRCRAIVANSGNSNVATGQKGLDDAIAMCRATADALGCEPHEVLPASTGVIGRPLPIDRILAGIADLGPQLAAGPDADRDAAQAILTTDLVPKFAVVESEQLPGVTLAGIAKGSGMIAPSMATMLVFLTTDADLPPQDLQHALALANAASFSRISVDSDTSTSDTAYLLASGAADHAPITRDTPAFEAFVASLTKLCQDLADQVVRDGEGATLTFAVHVRNAASIDDADRVGRAVVDSPLVKTAIHGRDPNWGRLVMAAGKSGATIDPDRFTATIQGVTVFENGTPTVTEPDALAALSAKMDQASASGGGGRITIELDLHQDDPSGGGDATWLGCDLSRQYIAINADYTT